MYDHEGIAKSVESLMPHTVNVFLTTYYVLSELPSDMLSRQEERDLLLAALLHDIGKSLWPDDWHVESKPKLETNVFSKMQSHPLTGANMAYEAGLPESVASLIRQHHERPGGDGYPLGVEPSLPAIVLAACDVYCACIEKRPYRKQPLTRQETILQVAKFAPPEVVEALTGKAKKKQPG